MTFFLCGAFGLFRFCAGLFWAGARRGNEDTELKLDLAYHREQHYAMARRVVDLLKGRDGGA